ncbi:hypothetical protein [Bordetella muralis]|uniref:hypothetical protein n=1 Tax=Bordetella muralis TaxID=1649130 RepID=UPI0039EF0725
MAQTFFIKNIFRLGDGTTALACQGDLPASSVTDVQAILIDETGKVRQTIQLIGKRTMVNATRHRDLCLLETRDTIELSADEAQQGKWQLTVQSAPNASS